MQSSKIGWMRSLLAMLVLIGSMALFVGLGCSGVADTVQRKATEVWAGQPIADPPNLTDDDVHSLVLGDAVRTDTTGEARLTLYDCKGEVYVFNNTQFGAYTCRRAEQASGSLQCLRAGDAGFNLTCAGRLVLDTPNSQIVIQGTAFTVTYLPEKELSLVTVLRGKVDVRAIVNAATEALGAAVTVKEGYFYYTMPGRDSPELADVPARQPVPLKELPALAGELGLEPRMRDLTLWGVQQKVLPIDWPPEWQAEGGVDMTGGGGALEDARVEEAVLIGANFPAVIKMSFGGQKTGVTAEVGGKLLDARTIAYDPERARKLLAEGGYADGLTLELAYPEGDDELATAAANMATNLGRVGIKAGARPVAGSELEGWVRTARARGRAVVRLKRR